MPDPERHVSIMALDDSSSPTASETATIETALVQSSASEDPSELTPATSGEAPPQNDESAPEINPEEKNFEETREAHPGEDEDTKKRWNLSATLYCPENGHPHSNLPNFGLTKCPLCGQNLVMVNPPPISPPFSFFGDYPRSKKQVKDKKDMEVSQETNDEPKGVTEVEKDEVNEEESDPIPEHLRVSYEVEYRDLGDYHIISEPRNQPFQLERERNTALSQALTRNKETIFKVVTVLRTTIGADANRMSWEKTEIMEKGIIGNPQISVAIQYTRVIILSALFIDALKSVVSYDTQDKLESGKLDLDEPFSIIGHHLEELEAYIKRLDDQDNANAIANNPSEVPAAATRSETNSVDRETRIHVRLVLSFVSAILKDPIAKELDRRSRDVPTCTYRMMWYLFRPGETVYVMSDEAEEAYMVDSVEMDKFSLSSMDIDRVCLIKLWYLDFNGESITRARHEATIKPFKGERPITSLNVVPCKIWDKMDGGKLRTILEARVKKWMDHLLGKQVEYRGEPFRPGKKTVDGRAYADPTSYYSLDNNTPNFEPMESEPPGSLRGCTCSSCTKAREDKSKLVHKSGSSYDNLSIKQVGELVDESARSIGYLLCSRKLKGFVFSTRAWETLDIRYCQPVKPDKNPFARLVMPDETKMMIKALFYKYTDPRFAGDSSQVWGADFIKNKGEGQVFLLHGGPGVGKTFTAECIAEFTGRALLALTCGDIGTEEVQMEKKLRSWLRLAHKWGAVMLIDEADVFLEKRMDSDFQRNSLVSVFLREIEYYQGILFLTSNRVGKFDDAIVSRIHVVIHYKGLDDEYRKKIWNQFFDKLEEERGSKIKIENSARRYVLDSNKMVEMKWNGREIRNAFQTAVALAEYRFLTKPEPEREDGEIAVLEEEDFKQICDMTMKFKEYLIEMNEGQDEAMRARQEKTRVSDY